MLSFTTEIFVTHLIRADDIDHRHTRLDLVPAHYSISYELSGEPSVEVANSILKEVASTVNQHVVLHDGVGAYAGLSFSRELVLIGRPTIQNMAVEMFNLAMSVCVGSKTEVESCKVHDLESGVAYTFFIDQ